LSPAVTLLGSVSFRRSDGVVVDASAVPTSKALDLLRLLVGAGDHARTADHYIGLLWPTADEERGRMSLRTALAQLRRAFGPDVVRRSGEHLTLGNVESDVARLRRGRAAVERHLSRGNDHEVLRLVRTLEESSGDDLVVSSGSCEAVYLLRE
jgi:DNA-binding SARP family transcriptional activator